MSPPGIGDVGAVHARAPLRAGQLERGRVDRDAGYHEPRVLEAAIGRHRHGGERLVADVHGQARSLRIDDRRFAGHRHGLRHRTDAQCEVDVDHAIETHGRLANDALESGELGLHIVGRRRQVGDAVEAVAVGDRGELTHGLGTGQRHRDAWQHGAARIGDFSGHRTGRRALRGRHGRHEQQGEHRQDAQGTCHVILPPDQKCQWWKSPMVVGVSSALVFDPRIIMTAPTPLNATPPQSNLRFLAFSPSHWFAA